MTKPDYYRAKADECEQMAGQAANADDKARWRKLAADWLTLIPLPRRSAAKRYDAAEGDHGTH
jgi:hypothetical protein